MLPKRTLAYFLLIGAVCSALVALAQMPTFFAAGSELWNVLSGQTNSYETGHAIGACLRAVSRLGLPYVLWMVGQKELNKQLA